MGILRTLTFGSFLLAPLLVNAAQVVYLGGQSVAAESPRLVESASGGFGFVGERHDLRLPALATGTTQVVGSEGDWITFRPLWLGHAPVDEAQPLALPSPGVGEIGSGGVRYADTFPGVDESFSATRNGLKHDLWLSALPVVAGERSGDLVFAWEVRVSPGLVPMIDGEEAVGIAITRGSILFRSADGSVPLGIAAATIVETLAIGRHHAMETTGELHLIPAGDAHRLELRVPLAWLDDPARVYPVRVDPTIEVNPLADPETGFVAKASGASYERSVGAMDSGTLNAINPQWVTVNAYSRFSTQAIPDAARIESVQLEVWISNHDNPTDPAVSIPMQIHEVSIDPLTASNKALFDAVGGGQVYINTNVPRTGNEFCASSYARFVWNLPPQAVALLQSQLPLDRFSLGFTSSIVTDPGFDHLDYIGYPETVLGGCGPESVPGKRIALKVVFQEENRPPFCANAGPYSAQCAGPTTSLPVDGSASSDPDSDPLSYFWSTDCPGGQFQNRTAPATTLTVDSQGACDQPCTVTLEVSDGEDTTACTETVVVRDSLPPTITGCPRPLSLECTGPGGVPSSDPAVVAWAGGFTATDQCSIPDLNSDAPAVFPSACAPGLTTPVDFRAVDGCQNAAVCSSDVTVTDTTAPSVTAPVDAALECDGLGGMPATHADIAAWLASVTGTDVCSTVTITNDAPSFFPSDCDPGIATAVEFVGKDGCALEDRDGSVLTIRDTTGPAIMLSPPLELECSEQGGVPGTAPAIVAWLGAASATDVCDGTADLSHDAPGFFPSGCAPGKATTVNFEGVDDCGNLARLGEDVTVVDTTPPTLTVPAPLELECDSPGGVLVSDARVQAWLLQAASSDICAASTITHDAPALLPSSCAGLATTITFRATDDCGNVTTLSSTITVRDTTPPELIVPAPLELECNSPGGVGLGDPQVQAWLLQAVATDVCGGVTLTNDAPGLFPSGCGPGATTTVRFEAVDDCGQVTVVTSTVTVRDTTPPSLTPPPALALECDGAGGISGSDQRIIDWLAVATASDLCDGAVLSDDAPSFFPSGCGAGQATTVTFRAVDNCGNDVSLSSTVTVKDTTAPTMTVPGPLELECNSPGGVPVTDPRIRAWLDRATASDVCGPATISDDAPTLLPSACGLGETTTVTFTATDDCGNVFELQSTITVRDTTPPTLSPPPPLVVECSSQGGVPSTDAQVQAWLAQVAADDICGGVTVSHDIPALLPSACGVGFETTVTFRAVDGCGLETVGTSTITVRDTTAPELDVPIPLELECDGPGGIPGNDPRIRAWLARATASDVCDGATLTDDAPSFFASGCGAGHATVVTFEAVDNCGNLATLTSTVTVRDTTPPVLTVPAPIDLECDGPGGIPATDPRIQSWLASATAVDVCDGAVVTNDAPTFFASGCIPGETTVVTFVATDNCGNASREASSITVVDTTPPEIESVGFDGACLWPPNHKYYCIDDVATEILARDVCDEDPPSLRVVECRSSQPDDGLGDGHTVNDCITINDGKGVCFRSERLGDDPLGRDYTVVVAVSDDCGNSVEAEGTIHVPHDQSSHPDCRRPNRTKRAP